MWKNGKSFRIVFWNGWDLKFLCIIIYNCDIKLWWVSMIFLGKFVVLLEYGMVYKFILGLINIFFGKVVLLSLRSDISGL